MTSNQKYWYTSIQNKISKGVDIEKHLSELFEKYTNQGKQKEIADIKVACEELKIGTEQKPITENKALDKDTLKNIEYCKSFNEKGDLNLSFDTDLSVKEFNFFVKHYSKTFSDFISKLETLNLKTYTKIINVQDKHKLDPSLPYAEGYWWIKGGEKYTKISIYSWHNAKSIDKSFYNPSGFGPYQSYKDSYYAKVSWGRLGFGNDLNDTVVRSLTFEELISIVISHLKKGWGRIFASLLKKYEKSLTEEGYL